MLPWDETVMATRSETLKLPEAVRRAEGCFPDPVWGWQLLAHSDNPVGGRSMATATRDANRRVWVLRKLTVSYFLTSTRNGLVLARFTEVAGSGFSAGQQSWT